RSSPVRTAVSITRRVYPARVRTLAAVPDPATAVPEELRPPPEPDAAARALDLLRRPDFARAFAATAISELGDAFQYVALMWFALVAGGPLGVVAVRLADSVPA